MYILCIYSDINIVVHLDDEEHSHCKGSTYIGFLM